MGKNRGEQRAAARLRQPKRRLSITERETDLAHSLIWFALVTKPQREIHAEKVISEIMPGAMAFTPRSTRTIKKPRHRHGERAYREIEVSAYPRYLFIGVPEFWGGLPWHALSPVSFLTGYLADPAGNPIRLRGVDVAQVMRASQSPLFKGRDREEEEAPFCEVLYPGELAMGLGALSSVSGHIVATGKGYAEFDTQSGPLKIPFEMLERCA